MDQHNQLIKQHLWLVRAVARRLRQILPRSVNSDDLLADGAVGLLRASLRFDPQRNIPFARLAVRYIRGEMLDGLRRWQRCGRIRSPSQDRRVSEERADLPERLNSLPNRWALVVRLYYLESMTMREVAKVLGVSEPCISQIIRKALQRLRKDGSGAKGRKTTPRTARSAGRCISPLISTITDRTR